MAKPFYFVLLTLLVALVAVGAQEVPEGFHYVTPSTFDQKLSVLVSGKARDYYLLEPGKQIELKVTGPSRLRVLSRLVMESPKDSTEYTFLALKKDSKKTVSFTHKSYSSEKATLGGQLAGAVGESRTKVVDIPKGDQTYSFYLPKNATKKVLLRFAVETNDFTSGAPVVAMTPTEYTTQVDLISGEKVVPYYRVGTGHTVSLKLIGPATLKVLSRIEFDSTMTGIQKWRVQVTEDVKVKGTYSLSAGKSDTTAYREPSSLTASRAETFFVEVPTGSHSYDFKLPDNHRTALLRFLLPKNQLAKE
jgi:hypothetical protein